MSESFRPADDPLLLLRLEPVPGCEIVHVLLHEHVAPAGKAGVLVTDARGVDRVLADRVLRAVDKAGEIAIVEVAEPVHLVDGRQSAAEPRDDLDGQLEAEIHAVGPDVEEEIARRRDRMAGVGNDLGERVELGRTGIAEERVPGIGADADDARGSP